MIILIMVKIYIYLFILNSQTVENVMEKKLNDYLREFAINVVHVFFFVELKLRSNTNNAHFTSTDANGQLVHTSDYVLDRAKI